jgi:rhamnosyltransferase
MSRFAVIVPTLNAGPLWLEWLDAFDRQTLKPDPGCRLVVDSASGDATPALARERGFSVQAIARSEFNHGGTRQAALESLPDAEILVFLTQDALLDDSAALEKLVEAFADQSVGAAYGRQLPHRRARPIGSHARLFNYPARSEVRSLADRERLGIKTAFISNSFAAYRRSALTQAGGFPRHTIMNEDTFVAGKLLMAGWKIAYRADATVRHSHDYGFRDEFKRYFDIGVFHAHTPWLRETFGGAAGEGRRFVISELSYLARRAPWLIPSMALRTALKWLGFTLGSSFDRRLPLGLKRTLSLHRAYWSRA